jgi:hypothetical protein
MNARLEKGFERYEADVRAAGRGEELPEGLEDVAGRVGQVRGLVRQLDEAVRLLTGREPPEFSGEELTSVLIAAGWEEWRVEEALAKLLDEGRIMEVRVGSFRLA